MGLRKKKNGKKKPGHSRRVAAVGDVLAGQLDIPKGVRLAVARKIIEELGRIKAKDALHRKKLSRLEGRKEAHEEDK